MPRIRQRALHWWAACLFGCALPSQAALRLYVQDDASSPARAEAAQQILDDALRRLPPVWVAAVDRRIRVEWRDDLPAGVHGRARGSKLFFRRTLLDDWMARPAGAGDNDPATRAALAAVVHELAHVLDRSPHGRLSHDPRLLDLAGWQVSPLRLGLRTSRNAFTDRSPDRYELDSPAEFVAVNLEYFVLDPAYACRRPALHRYFVERFGMPSPPADCAPGLPYLQPDAEAGQAPLLELDPARVYAVDYLLAEGNDQAMSRWGHGMLRLVVCAPGRPRGPDCRLDLQYHRVLSFRAFVDDVQVSSWRGLTGSYPSRLFVLPLQQVVDEYTKVQLRGLQSIPLRLRDDEIAMLLERAARVHWSYDGRYYFLSNNCAVETYKLLHDGIPRLAEERLSSITPNGLLQRLERAGIADATVLDNRQEALRLGYRFAPANAHYQEMFDVARSALQLPPASVEDWLDLPPEDRAPWLERGDLRASAALLLLEQAAQRREELRARDALKRLLLGHRASAGHGGVDARARLQAMLALEGLFSHPAMLLPTGYGLPQRAEREALAAEATRQATRLREQDQHLRSDARALLPQQQRARLAAIEGNIDLLGRRLRHLHRDSGGLDLDRIPAAPGLPEPRAPD
ncbi:DUF4105 domain-containing protein [Luteimonas mephitis]|uniref:DUF7844 domain-containing protein n=1 Tax=Luteimonas mephitis TaxID=83615 RepID=UPI00041197AC|nr:DUF4105 domain-containing protein [Luteimonas mephitis]